jgi:uncharacterized membrane protein YeaQ/YmgE (transglycosylase-associated protein family)
VTVLGWAVLIVGGLVIGVAAQWLLKSDWPYRWVITAIAAVIGAWISSEVIFTTWTPVFEGITVWPAVIGGLVVGIVVDLIAAYLFRQQAGGSQGQGAVR